VYKKRENIYTFFGKLNSVAHQWRII